MGAGHDSQRRHPRWGEPPPGILRRWLDRAQMLLAQPTATTPSGLGDLPLALRHGELADAYLAAARKRDHQAAAAAAVAAMESALTREDWWAADVWAHRGLWHYEQSGDTLQAARQARRIGDLRSAGGDPASARRYYAEAIDESRDIGAEHEQGLAALGLGRAMMDLGEVTSARRMASAAVDLLGRAGAPAAEIGEAERLRGIEQAVGERTEESDA